MPRIRYWAAAKTAAGVQEEWYDATTLGDLVEAAKAAHGDPLSTVLDRCSWIVDEAPIGGRDHASVTLSAGSTAEALPPFAGG